MLRLSLRLLFVGLIVTPPAGCATIESWRSPASISEYSSKTGSGLQERVNNELGEEDEDVVDAAESASDDRRAELILDEPPDPWFGKYNYADKGRAIERNLR